MRGLNIQLATISTPLAAPVIARARLRKGNTASATGAGRLLAQAIATARAAGVQGQILCRADSAYYGWAFVGAAIRNKAWFSVTARMTKTVTAAIASIEEDAWAAIKYPNAIWEEAEQRWVSDAEVAEVPFTAFTGRRKAEHVTCRLIVRRVKRLQRLASDGTEQGELFATYRHHAFITNSTLAMVEADQRHRDHAIVEQVIAELKDGPLAHLPSGKYAANAAWVACAVIAFNLARAAAVAADLAKARWATLRRKIIQVPGRIASTSRRLDLHLPTRWPWAEHWESLHAVATGPPITADDLTTQPKRARPEDHEVEEPGRPADQPHPPASATPRSTEITDRQSPSVDQGSVGVPQMSTPGPSAETMGIHASSTWSARSSSRLKVDGGAFVPDTDGQKRTVSTICRSSAKTSSFCLRGDPRPAPFERPDEEVVKPCARLPKVDGHEVALHSALQTGGPAVLLLVDNPRRMSDDDEPRDRRRPVGVKEHHALLRSHRCHPRTGAPISALCG